MAANLRDVSTLPRHIQADAAALNKYLESGGDGTAPADALVETGQTSVVADAPANTPTDAPANAPTDAPKPTPAKSDAPADAPADAPKTVTPEAYADLEQRYKTLDMLLKQSSADRVKSESALNFNVRQLTKQLEEQTGGLQDTPAKPVAVVTDADRADFGDSIAVMERVVAEAIQPLLADGKRLRAIEARLNALAPEVEATAAAQASTHMSVYEASLDKLVPGWRSLRADAAFNTYLTQIHPDIGVSYKELILNAESRGEADRVAHLIKGWEGWKPASSHPVANEPQAEGAPKPQPDELLAQVAPSISKTTTSEPVKPDTGEMSAADYEQLRNDISKGKYNGDELVKVRAKLHKAGMALQT